MFLSRIFWKSPKKIFWSKNFFFCLFRCWCEGINYWQSHRRRNITRIKVLNHMELGCVSFFMEWDTPVPILGSNNVPWHADWDVERMVGWCYPSTWESGQYPILVSCRMSYNLESWSKYCNIKPIFIAFLGNRLFSAVSVGMFGLGFLSSFLYYSSILLRLGWEHGFHMNHIERK